jgi:HlyD family secretion protein
MRNPLTPRRLVAGAVGAAVLVGAVATAGARSDDGPAYRTTTASTQEVDQVLDAVGTVEPVSQASVAFPVAGTVASVGVRVGQEVTVGTPLASLDVADLEDAVTEERAALDRANLTLELALAGEDVGSVGGTGNPSGGFARSATAAVSSEIQAAQQAVLDAQEAVDESSAAAALALENAATACAASSASATTSTTTTPPDASACLAALEAVQVAQQQVAADQAALTEAAAALTALLDEEAEGPTTPPTTTSTTTAPSAPEGSDGSSGSDGSTSPDGSSAPDGSSSSDGTDGSGADAGSSPSAEDLIAYQKQVDAAEDALAVAEQAVDQATIVSPIDGRVASVGLAVGDEVEAGSSTQAIVIVGEGGFEVTASISVKDLPDVEVGQAATVTPDGDHEPVEGEIVRIGVTGDSSGSTTTYPVTIALTGDTSEMGNGSTASVSIVTSAVGGALAVPTSAVTVDGDRATVQVVEGGVAKATTVETGAIGQVWTEITDGLDEGDEVVLADLDEPLPGSATDTSSNGSGQDRQFPGGAVTFGGPPTGARPGG